MATPVFYDPERNRWKRLRRMLHIAGVLLTLLIVFFAVSLYRLTSLGSLNLPEEHRPYRAVKASERPPRPRKPATRRNVQVAPSQVVLNAAEGVRAAFYVTWDEGSFASLK